MPSEKDNILKFNQSMKSDKVSYIIYADVGLLIKKIDVFAKKIGEHISCRYSM